MEDAQQNTNQISGYFSTKYGHYLRDFSKVCILLVVISHCLPILAGILYCPKTEITTKTFVSVAEQYRSSVYKLCIRNSVLESNERDLIANGFVVRYWYSGNYTYGDGSNELEFTNEVQDLLRNCMSNHDHFVNLQALINK